MNGEAQTMREDFLRVSGLLVCRRYISENMSVITEIFYILKYVYKLPVSKLQWSKSPSQLA